MFQSRHNYLSETDLYCQIDNTLSTVRYLRVLKFSISVIFFNNYTENRINQIQIYITTSISTVACNSAFDSSTQDCFSKSDCSENFSDIKNSVLNIYFFY